MKPGRAGFRTAAAFELIALVLFLRLGRAARAADSHLLWQIGKAGATGTPFSAKFRADMVFIVGQSDPAKDWPAQQPGPADSWAGGGPQTITILFGVKTPGDGMCRLVLDLLDTHAQLPPLLAVSVNDRALPPQQTAAGTGNYQDPSHGKASRVSFEFPATALHPGDNVIRITNTRGSWLFYDRVALETPAALTGEETGGIKSPALFERAAVDVDTAQTVVTPFMGLGVQWEPFAYEPSVGDSKTIRDRLDFMRPGYFRVMSSCRDYCLGFGADRQPRYVWKDGDARQRARFERLCDILAYAQSRGIDCIFGEWGPPRGLITDETDPRWARIVADGVSYLRQQRGFTIIRYYNLINEPNGDWSGNKDYPTWVAAVQNFHREFVARGLSPEVRIIGPDTTGNSHWTEPFDWLDRAAKEIPTAIGAWDLHWYAEDPEVLSGTIERVLRERRQTALRMDPNAAGKPMFLGESGLLTGRTNGDQQPRVKTYEYGVMMSDYVAQAARAGWMGALAWDLDDAMHAVNGNHVPDPPDNLTLKIWGFWNSQGPRMGHPEEMKVRPWFYTWSLMSRLFPKNSRIVSIGASELPRFRTMAGLRRVAGIEALTIMLVNDSGAHRVVTVRDPARRDRVDLTVYHYFEGDRPVGIDDYPAVSGILKAVDLKSGVTIDLPSRGVVFLTTEALQSGDSLNAIDRMQPLALPRAPGHP